MTNQSHQPAVLIPCLGKTETRIVPVVLIAATTVSFVCALMTGSGRWWQVVAGGGRWWQVEAGGGRWRQVVVDGS